MKKQVLLAICILFFLSGCDEKTPDSSAGRNDRLMFNSSAYHNSLKYAFVPGSQVFSTSMGYLDTMYLYYLAQNFNPLFIKSFEEDGLVFSVLNLLSSAGDHGLDPEWYHVSAIKEEFLNAVSGDSVYSARYEHLANTELLIADAIVRYAWHMRYGVVNPKEIYEDSYFLPVPDSASRDLFEPLKQHDVIAYLNKIQPNSKKYKELQAALKYYEQFRDLQLIPISVPIKKIEPGNQDSLVIEITERLIQLGCIDTAEIKINHGSLYDSLLVLKVKEFQRSYGLTDDGIIGKATIEKLNTPPAENYDKIKLNLERFRWSNFSSNTPYILVNIPDFRLYLIDEDRELFDIKVCTGKRRSVNFQAQMELYKKTNKLYHKPDDWETPNMTGEISYLVLNPTWTVPQSIIREEIANEVNKDSTYLIRKNFKVFKDGLIVDPTGIPSSEFLNYTRLYQVVQDPGAGNALGKIKFMFNNPFGIYLHDTPSRAPFNLSNRAVSHGCIRVEKPLQLSEYVLKNQSKWTLDYLKLEIGVTVEDKSVRDEYYQKRNALRKNLSYGKTTEVKLDNKIQIIVDYYTAWVDKDGKLHFREDVYRRDKILAAHLFPGSSLKEDIVMN